MGMDSIVNSGVQNPDDNLKMCNFNQQKVHGRNYHGLHGQ